MQLLGPISCTPGILTRPSLAHFLKIPVASEAIEALHIWTGTWVGKPHTEQDEVESFRSDHNMPAYALRLVKLLKVGCEA